MQRHDCESIGMTSKIVRPKNNADAGEQSEYHGNGDPNAIAGIHILSETEDKPEGHGKCQSFILRGGGRARSPPATTGVDDWLPPVTLKYN